FEVNEGSCGEAPASELVGGIDAEGGEAVGVLVGIGMEKDGVDDAEDGGGGADAEGEGEDCGEGETGGFAELAEGEAGVGEEGAEGGGDAGFAGHFWILGRFLGDSYWDWCGFERDLGCRFVVGLVGSKSRGLRCDRGYRVA